MLILFFLTLSLGLTAQSNLDKGNVAYKARNYHDAIANYEQASMTNPTNSTLLQNLADCYRITNKMDKAARYYKQICQPNTVTPPIHYYRYGLVLQSLQKYDLAMKIFDVYAKVNPKKANKAKEACLFAKTHATANASAFTISKESINFKGYDNYAPVLQPKYLVFSSSTKVPLQGGSSRPKSDNYLYKSTMSPSGQLVGQQLVKKPVEVTPPHNLAPFAVNANETFAISTLNQFSNGVRHISEASLSFLSMEINHQIKSIEYFPVGYDFPYMSNHSASFPALANNGNSIYFAAADYPGGQGGYDIWVIHRQGNGWTRPINLGPNVNTAGDEVCPFIASNGNLFFSSDYHKGFGGYDVFQAKNIQGTWKEVRNLGNQVNSSYDDMYFIYDAGKRLGYFSSNRKNDFMNIYRANMTGSESLFLPVNTSEVNAVVASPPSTTTTTKPTTTPSSTTTTSYGTTTSSGTVQQTTSGGFRPKPSVTTPKPAVATTTTKPATTGTPTVGSKPTVGNGNTIPCAMNFYIGAIVDAKTKRPVKGAKVFIQNIRSDKGKQVKDPTNMYGEYSVILDPLSDFTIYISKLGYQSLVFDVNTGSGGKKTLLGTRELSASPMSQRDEFGNVVANDPTIVTNNKPTRDELLHPTHSSSKYFSRHSGGRPTPSEGYMIKVFALSKPISAAQKLKLQEYGNLMAEKKGNLTIYQLGIYADQAHVLKLLPEVQKINPEARIITKSLDNNHLGGVVALASQLVYPPIKKESPTLPNRPNNMVNNNSGASNNNGASNSSSVGNGLTNESPTIIENDRNSWTNKDLPEGFTPRGDMPTPGAKPVILFKVKVGAYSKPENASFSNIKDLGMIEQTKSPKDGLTRFYISSFKTLAAAQSARDKAQEKGILNPSIIAFENGKEISLTEALNKL